MIKIGITGSLASGKTTVAKLIAKKKYPYFSADKVVNGLYKKHSFIKLIKKKFNIQKTKNIKGKIKIILKKDKKKLKKLELIIHPIVRRQMKSYMKLKNKNKISIFEIPLLIESKLTKYFDIVVFVAARRNLRMRRYLKRGGNKKIFTLLEKRQKKQSKKIKICDYVIYNNKTKKYLINRVKNFINKYE